ncbi:MAG TPA: LLM class F420-dependent oxidoreductase [Acidimicrobiales bacterium]|nr:LLM class F420-dependent oxidoreductase [Acidimicrobiales bacterium]
MAVRYALTATGTSGPRTRCGARRGSLVYGRGKDDRALVSWACNDRRVRFGLHALGIASGANPEVILAVAEAAESSGFATLWAGEHVVMIDGADSPYPYSPDGRIAVPATADWLDPWATLTFAASVTSRIQLATGLLLLPEHNPLVVAKQAASLDVLSKGRFLLGVGIGWSAGEFAALGVPFARRARRTREYVEALRVLWREDPCSYMGEFVAFSSVRSFPKPVQRRIPVVLGGNSDRALARVAQYGDGWYGFNVPVHGLPSMLGSLVSACRGAGRDAKGLEIAVSLCDGHPGQVEDLAAMGVTQLVLVASPPSDPQAARPWAAELAEHWSVEVDASTNSNAS